MFVSKYNYPEQPKTWVTCSFKAELPQNSAGSTGLRAANVAVLIKDVAVALWGQSHPPATGDIIG